MPKPFQMPARSLSMQCLTTSTEAYLKTDLIAELKISKDIPGIKKMKVEKQLAGQFDSEHYSEITKQFSANNYMDQVRIFNLRDKLSGHFIRFQSFICRFQKKTRRVMSFPNGSGK